MTHHLDDIIPEIDRVILLNDGAVVLDGPKDEILTAERLSEIFRAPVNVLQQDGFYHAW